MKLFLEVGLYESLNQRRWKMTQEIESQPPNYLLNVNEVEFIRHQVDKFRIEPLTIYEDRTSVTNREDWMQTHGQPTRRQIIRLHVPFSGEKELLKLRPSSGPLWTEDVLVGDDEIMLDRVDRNNEPAPLKREFDGFLNNLKTQVGHSSSEVTKFNDGLEQTATEAVRRRKAELLRQSNLVASLGIPLKKATDVPPTFAVPSVKKNIVVVKPAASSAAFAPEPTINDNCYNQIVKAIHDMGVEAERHPGIYEGKDEETLRDHFLMMLAPNFSSVSGETFNKAGKTDILIRHDGKNLFVAECAVWKGAKNFLGKIDQLLSYLTWRDSKTALICFVRNKEMTAVLDTIKKEVPSHARFLKEEAPSTEGWLRYLFTLPDDQHRTVQTAILCFHMP